MENRAAARKSNQWMWLGTMAAGGAFAYWYFRTQPKYSHGANITDEAKREYNIGKHELGKAKDEAKGRLQTAGSEAKKGYETTKGDVKSAVSNVGSGLMGVRREDIPQYRERDIFPSPRDVEQTATDLGLRGHRATGWEGYKERVIDAASQDPHGHDFLPGTGRADSLGAHIARLEADREELINDRQRTRDPNILERAANERKPNEPVISSLGEGKENRWFHTDDKTARSEWAPGNRRSDTPRSAGSTASGESWIGAAEDKTRSAAESAKEKYHEAKDKIARTGKDMKAKAEDTVETVKEKASALVGQGDPWEREQDRLLHAYEAEIARLKAEEDKARLSDSRLSFEDRARAAGALAANKTKETVHDLQK